MTTLNSHAFALATRKEAYLRCFRCFVRICSHLSVRSYSPRIAQLLRESISINSGLLALGNVIEALSNNVGHVPYRCECRAFDYLAAVLFSPVAYAGTLN